MQAARSRMNDRVVFRPGVWQYVAILSGPAVLSAGLTIVYGVAIGLVAAVGFGLLMMAPIVVYLAGVAIELDAERVSKLYFFGLFRRSILLEQLRSTNHEESGSDGFAVTAIEFRSADGKGSSFNVIPFWAWRPRDIESLGAIARKAGSADWRS
jgi:hypothetical protein